MRFSHLAFLLLFAGIHLGLSIFLITPGHFSLDEVLYHLMVKQFSETGELTIGNGYQEYLSPEFIPHAALASQGKLVSQYPYLFAVLAAPFYRYWGYRGIFFVNVIAFSGIVALCYASAQKLFQDRILALTACVILVLATFSWEYSQAVWPHTVFTCFVMFAFYLFIRAFFVEMRTAACFFGLLSGLVTGFAVGIRLDAVFIIPCFFLPFIFSNPCRFWPALTFGLGTLPGLVILSLTNYVKFGVFRPLSYGGLIHVEQYLPFVWLSTGVMFFAWILSRPSMRTHLMKYIDQILIVAIFLSLIIFLTPSIRHAFKQQFHAIYQILIDLRGRAWYLWEPSLSRSSGGGMVYAGGLKKALLQSCPYLIMVLFPMLHASLRTKKAVPLSLLYLIPVAFTGFYAAFAWHGGAAFNLRYLLPIFPFTSILCAYTWRKLTKGHNWRNDWISAAAVIITVVAYFFVLRPNFTTVDQQEFPYLTLPLILAGALSLLALAQAIKIKPLSQNTKQPISSDSLRKLVWLKAAVSENFTRLQQRVLPHATIAICLVAMIWAGLVALFYDYPLTQRIRQADLQTATTLAPLLADGAIIFTKQPASFFILIDHLRLRIADPRRDNFRDFPALMTFYLRKGRAVYAMFSPPRWKYLRDQGVLDPETFRILPITSLRGQMIYQIMKK